MDYLIFPLWMAIASGLGVFGFACLMDPEDHSTAMPFEEFLSLFETAPPASP